MVTIIDDPNASIFDSPLQAIVNPINCVGVMGGGLALEFKRRYPDLFRSYAERCGDHQVHPGEPYLYRDMGGRWILNFPTKNHWQEPSEMWMIVAGLGRVLRYWDCWYLTGIAFPALGCGLGGLDPEVVIPIMVKILDTLPIPTSIYLPR